MRAEAGVFTLITDAPDCTVTSSITCSPESGRSRRRRSSRSKHQQHRTGGGDGDRNFVAVGIEQAAKGNAVVIVAAYSNRVADNRGDAQQQGAQRALGVDRCADRASQQSWSSGRKVHVDRDRARQQSCW